MSTSSWHPFTALSGVVRVPPLRHVPTELGSVAVRDTAPDDRRSPVVVLVHGWGSDSLSNFHQLFEPLHAARWRVVAPDLPGFGATALHSRWSMEHAASVVRRALDTLDVRHAVWAGYSMGGPVTQTMALLASRSHGPAPSAGLVQLATAAHIVPSRTSRTALFAAEQVWRTAGEATTTLLRLANTANAAPRRAASTLAAHSVHLARTTNKRAVAQSGAALARFDSRPWVSTLDVPRASCLVTAADSTVPPPAQRDLSRLLDAQVWELEADHHVCLHPVFASTLVALLEHHR